MPSSPFPRLPKDIVLGWFFGNGPDLTRRCCQLFGIAQVVAISLAVKSGLGQRQDLLDPSALPKIMKVLSLPFLSSTTTNLVLITLRPTGFLRLRPLLHPNPVSRQTLHPAAPRPTRRCEEANPLMPYHFCRDRCLGHRGAFHICIQMWVGQGVGAKPPKMYRCRKYLVRLPTIRAIGTDRVAQMSFWIGIGVIDVLTEFAILAIPRPNRLDRPDLPPPKRSSS